MREEYGASNIWCSTLIFGPLMVLGLWMLTILAATVVGIFVPAVAALDGPPGQAPILGMAAMIGIFGGPLAGAWLGWMWWMEELPGGFRGSLRA